MKTERKIERKQKKEGRTDRKTMSFIYFPFKPSDSFTT